MQRGIVLAAALTAQAVIASATPARADDWCGYITKDNAVIECGYTTAQDCESAVGKGGMCFINPDNALNTRPTAPATSTPTTKRG